MLKLFQFGPVGTPSDWFLCPFDVSPSFFVGFLTSLHTRIVQAHLLFLPKSWSQPFLHGALVPFLREKYLETKI